MRQVKREREVVSFTKDCWGEYTKRICDVISAFRCYKRIHKPFSFRVIRLFASFL